MVSLDSMSGGVSYLDMVSLGSISGGDGSWKTGSRYSVLLSSG